MNNDARGAYNTNSQIKFKTTILKSSLCDYSDVYILLKGTRTVVGEGADAGAITADKNNKQAIFKNCPSLTDYINEINNNQVTATGLEPTTT